MIQNIIDNGILYFLVFVCAWCFFGALYLLLKSFDD